MRLFSPFNGELSLLNAVFDATLTTGPKFLASKNKLKHVNVQSIRLVPKANQATAKKT